MRNVIATIILTFLLTFSGSAAWSAEAPVEVPAKGMVTMVDLGAKSCIPCKMMAPILAELATEYQGKAAIMFIDVRERPDQAPVFNIRAIPTQIFYDKDGRERWRHQGFLDKESIVAKLRELGVDGKN